MLSWQIITMPWTSLRLFNFYVTMVSLINTAHSHRLESLHNLVNFVHLTHRLDNIGQPGLIIYCLLQSLLKCDHTDKLHRNTFKETKILNYTYIYPLLRWNKKSITRRIQKYIRKSVSTFKAACINRNITFWNLKLLQFIFT